MTETLHKTIIADADDIDTRLDALSESGWTVVHYAPVAVTGQAGVGSVRIVALMTRPARLAEMLEEPQ